MENVQEIRHTPLRLIAATAIIVLIGALGCAIGMGAQHSPPFTARLGGDAPAWMTSATGANGSLGPDQAFRLGERQRRAQDFSAEAFQGFEVETPNWRQDDAGVQKEAATLRETQKWADARNRNLIIGPLFQDGALTWPDDVAGRARAEFLQRAEAHISEVAALLRAPQGVVVLRTDGNGRFLAASGPRGLKSLVDVARAQFPTAQLYAEADLSSDADAALPLATRFQRAIEIVQIVNAQGGGRLAAAVRLSLDCAKDGRGERLETQLKAGLARLRQAFGAPVSLTGLVARCDLSQGRTDMAKVLTRLAAEDPDLQALYLADWTGAEDPWRLALIAPDGGVTAEGEAFLTAATGRQPPSSALSSPSLGAVSWLQEQKTQWPAHPSAP